MMRAATRPILAAGVAILWGALSSEVGASPDPLEAIPGDGPILELEACVAEALRGNSDLTRERHRRQELRGQGWQAVSTALPTVDFVGNWNRSRDPSFLLDESFSGQSEGGTTSAISPETAAVLDELGPLLSFPDPDDLPAQSFWRASLSSQWELNPFRIVNSMSAVNVRLKQHEIDLLAETHRIAEETIRVFHEVSLHRERVAAIDAEVEAREEFLDITRRRYRLELSTELDTLQAAVSVANLRPESRRARKDLRNAASRLNLVMGREPLTPLTIQPVGEVETGAVGTTEALALANGRPDLRSLDLQVAFLRKRRGVERAEARPFLSMGGSYGYVARSVDNLGEQDYWDASVSLVVPLFDGLLTKGKVQELEGSLSQTEESVVDARRRARLEVATTLEEREAARESWDAATLTLTAADRALEQTTMRYELGQVEFLEVLNSQAQRFDARRNLIQARYDLLVATASLKRSLGSDPLVPLSRIRDESIGETMTTSPRRQVTWMLIVACVTGASLAGCSDGEAANDGVAVVEVPVNVRILTLERTTLSEYVSVSGPLRPIRGADISTEESGVVASIARDKGATVSQGEPLIRLSRDLLAAEMKSAAAGRALAEHNESRMRELFDANQISRQELLRTEAEAADAKARAEMSRLRWERADVKAPFDGIVAARFVELGEFVSAGMPVMRVVDPYTLEVRGSVSEREAAWIRSGARASVTVDGAQVVLEGNVHWISVEAATSTGKFPVEVRLNNSDLTLRPGVVARAEILKIVHEDVVIIPRDAILVQPDGPTVFVAEDDRAVVRRLKLGPDQGLMVVVNQGLETGDRLIVRGQRRVHDGTLVAIQEEATALDGSIDGDPAAIRAAEAFFPMRPEATGGTEGGS